MLRAKLYERFTQMTDAFRACDRDKNGVIDIKDFADVIANLGFARVTRGTIELLASKYDKNGDKLVTYAEFCAAIEGGPVAAAEPARAVLTRADRVEEAFRKQVLAGSTSLRRAFLKLDKDRSAHISPAELERVLRGAGIAVSEDEMAALVAKFDAQRDGRLDVAELSKLLDGGAEYAGNVGKRTALSPAKPAKRART